MRISGTMLPAPKHGMPWAVKCRMKKLLRVDSSYLEDKSKKVYELPILSCDGKGSVSILFLEPEAKISRHKHFSDSEVYIAWNTKKKYLKTEVCNQFDEHELENTSKMRWAWVISVKFDGIENK